MNHVVRHHKLMADGTAIGETSFSSGRWRFETRSLPALPRSCRKVTEALLLERSVPRQKVSISASYNVGKHRR